MKKTAEEIQELTGDYDIRTTFKHRDGKKYKLIPMEEFASQSPPEITDEEIEKRFPTDLKVICEQTATPINFNTEQGEYIDEVRYNHQLKQFGAKWYRAELRKRTMLNRVTTKDLKDIDEARGERGAPFDEQGCFNPDK